MVDQTEIHRMARSNNTKEQREALNQLQWSFKTFSDEEQAWKDLVNLTNSNDDDLRRDAANAFLFVSPDLSNKAMAWEDLSYLTRDRDNIVRALSTISLGFVFPNTPDKKNQAWQVLHLLAQDADNGVRGGAASAIILSFTKLPDKNQAWCDIVLLAHDRDSRVRNQTGSAINFNLALFSDSFILEVPDKDQAWNEIIQMLHDEDFMVQGSIMNAPRYIFPHVSNKEKAWHDLIHLIHEDTFFNVVGGSVIGHVFPYVPDKKRAWKNLIRLVHDKNIRVRENASYAISIASPYVTNKKQAYLDVLKLAKDKNNTVRAWANYFLGKTHILEAGEARSKEEFKKQLEKALAFFEKSAEDLTYFYPSRFCLPFYRSFYTIIFEKQEIETKVQNYLVEAKSSIEGSYGKEKLLEVIDNLANALKEARNVKNLKDITSNLNAYRQYIEHVVNLLDSTEEYAPGATKLLRKGLPIIDERIRDIIKEIQEKASIACQQSKGTKAEEIACVANREVQKWLVGDQEQMTKNVENLIFVLSLKVPSAPEFKYIHNEIDQIMMEPDITKQYQKISYLIALIPESVHIGDNIDQNVSGNNNQVIGKGNENKNKSEKSSAISNKPVGKKSLIDWINPPATIAAFVGFTAVEIGTYYYPISYNHLIGAVIAFLVFIIVAIFNKS